MFVIRMAWREMRASFGRLLFFFVCVALGVASIVVLRSVVQNVRVTLTREARAIVGADLIVQSGRPLPAEEAAELRAMLEAPDAGVRQSTEVIETQTMAAALDGQGSGRVRLVELRGVEASFPFYGTLELAGGQPYTHALLANHGALVSPEFLAEMGLRVGDTIRLAGQSFEIRGAVTRDRVQRSGGIAFGPRVHIDLADLRQTSLLGFGSRASYQLHLLVDEPRIGALSSRLRRGFPRDVATVRSWRSLEDRLGRNLTIAENYLSLVGFAIVVLGGVGVWSVTRVVVQQKIRSVAILKCLGASSQQVLGTYLLQVTCLALAGSVLGVALAFAAVAAIPPAALQPLGLTGASVTASAAAQGLAVGLLVSLLFALVPLLEVRRVKPLLLLRADTTATARRRDWASVTAGAAIAAALALVAVWQAGSLRAGLYVIGGLAAVSLLLLGAGRVLVAATMPLARSSRFAVRHAVISLGRPGNQTRVILMAVGLGCFFILAVRALQANLLHEFAVQIGGNAPDFVLIDIQQDQVAGVGETVAPYLTRPARFLPTLRARVAGVEGRRVHLPTIDDVRRQRRLTREYTLTYRDALQDNERLVDGRFWAGPLTTPRTSDGADTEVSIEREVSDEAQIGVGDLMRFSLAGHTISARVTSVREVIWDQTQNGGFIFVLRPGPAVERLPQSFLGFLEVDDDSAARGTMQRALVQRFPNVSAIDVTAVIDAIREIVDNATLAITIVGAVVLAGGVLILVGAVAMTKFQRLYETAIYRTLGASTRLVTAMVAVEYGMLGLLAGLLGAVGAFGMSWLLAEHLFEITWRPAVALLSAGVGLTAVTVSVVGLAASLDILWRKPLGVLRRE